ncbi:MAG TPA: hypothetical protein VJ732_12365, partial [Bryobacteraceae bacterium]|nr:hypothetical protein [Bryobacteraceae bacterium]
MPESLQSLRAPLPFLTEILGTLPARSALEEYGSWWELEGQAISDAIDRMGTPMLRMFDRFGKRIDEILFPREYWTALRKGYQAGAVWRAFCGDTLKACGLIQYITCFYDPGMCCPYVVSLSTA